MKTFFKRAFELDSRALFLFRIFLGALLIFDCLCRIPNAEIFYSDLGILTRADLYRHLQMPFKFSLLYLTGSPWGLYGLSVLGIAAGACLIAGRFLFAARLAGYLILCSFHARNPLLVHGGDNLLRLLFFYSLFLPLQPTHARGNKVLSPWSVIFVLQIFWIYIFTSLYKNDPSWISNFDALHYAFNLDSFITPLAAPLQHQSGLLKALTVLTIVTEAFGVFLFFIPWKQSFWRSIGVLSFLGLHVGIGLSFHVGIFSSAALAAWVALLPGEFFDFLEGKFSAAARFRERFMKVNASPFYLFRDLPKTQLLSALGVGLLVFAWNTEGLLGSQKFDVPSPFTEMIFAAQLNQQWNMFAPYPMKNDGWLVVKARMSDGQTLDLLAKDLRYSEVRPPMAERYPDTQWRKLFISLLNDRYSYFRGRFLNYYCHQWNDGKIPTAQQTALRALETELIFMRETTLSPENNTEAQKIEAVRLWVKTCDPKPTP